MASLILAYSSSLNCPIRIFQKLTPLSIANKRCISCVLDISKEKIATFFFKLIAACRTKSKAKEVLPIEGRAATIIKSDF